MVASCGPSVALVMRVLFFVSVIWSCVFFALSSRVLSLLAVVPFFLFLVSVVQPVVPFPPLRLSSAGIRLSRSYIP